VNAWPNNAHPFDSARGKLRKMNETRRAIEIRIRAERRTGQLLAELPKRRAAATKKREIQVSCRTTGDRPPEPGSLRSHGINPDQAAKWKQLAAIPEPEFEATLSAPSEPLSTARLIERKAKPMPDTAIVSLERRAITKG
jgi:hypothetical protein